MIDLAARLIPSAISGASSVIEYRWFENIVLFMVTKTSEIEEQN